MVYRFIDKQKEYFGLRWLCSRLGISLNCYYNYLQHRKSAYHKERVTIYERIKYIFYNNNKVIGHRMMKVILARYGIHISKTTAHKYMNKALNLSAVVMRKRPGYVTGKKHKIFDNLLKQNFSVDSKNKVWCSDFTYMRQPNGRFHFNCTILDLYDRSVVATKNSSCINTQLASDVLEKALAKENYPKGLILHSDQGVQYTSREFVDFCNKYGITQSMSRAGCPYDNAPMERYFNTFKNCFYYRFEFENTEVLDEMTREYVNWYNYVRPHSHNGYLTPMEVRYP